MLRPITAMGRITLDLITRARRLRITGIRRRHLSLAILRPRPAMPRLAILRRHLDLGILHKHLALLRLAILRRGWAMPCPPTLPLETQRPTARSGTGHITRKPEPTSETTANVTTAPKRGLWEGPA